METATTDTATDATPVSVISSKSMQVSLDNPIHAYQTIVSRAKPEYIVTLHKLLGTIAECAGELKH